MVPQGVSPARLVIVMPGAGYSFMGPIIYYPTQRLLETGSAVLTADYDFRFLKDGADFNRTEAIRFCLKEALKFAVEKYGNSVQIDFVGKSIGTRGLCFANELATDLKIDLSASKFVWMTPVWRDVTALPQMVKWPQRSLHLIGSHDPHYSDEIKLKLEAKGNTTVKVYADADHSLDIDRDLKRTFEIHSAVVSDISEFLDN